MYAGIQVSWAGTSCPFIGYVLPVYWVQAGGSCDRNHLEPNQTAAQSDFHLVLPCEPASLPEARAQLRDWCQANGLPNLVIANAQLAVTEAAANAVRHSGCIDFQIQGRMSATTLIVVVSDQGPGRPYPDPGGGLGTGIIRELAAVVAFEDTNPGTRVTMRLSTTPDPAPRRRA